MSLLQHKVRATAVLGSLVHPQRDALSLVPVVLAVIPALLGWQWLALLLLAASTLISVSTKNERSYLQEVVTLAAFGLPALTALRFIVLLLLGSAVWTEASIAIPIALAGLLIALLMVPARVLLNRLASRMKPRVRARNLSIADWPAPAPVALTMSRGLPMAIPELMVLAAGALVASSLVIVWVISSVAALASVLLVLFTAVLVKRVGDPYLVAILSAVRRAVSTLAPEVALYVGTGDAASVYQVKMWLPALERVEQSAIILMRSRPQFDALGPTSTPVLCVPVATDFLSMDLTTLRAGLFVANTGDVIHLVREPSLMSAFIGHGDSDKNSSANPFSKVYDQIWLAGEAGADRYRRANFGVHESQFVYVGRPQLDGIESQSGHPEPGALATVLYAPTWEGWNTEQQYSSLLGQGVEFVRAVLDSPEPIRLVYKPHPFTGRRLPKARSAHQQIMSMVAKANNANNAPAAPSQSLSAAQRHKLATLSAIAGEEVLDRFANEFWQRTDARTHVVVAGGDLRLYDCFNAASFMAADVSSVLSDFIASGKPFAVFNTSSLPDQEFVTQFPSALAATVVSSDGNNIDEVLRTITGSAPDVQAAARAEQHQLLLGPADPPATERFAAAVSALVEGAQARELARTDRA